MKRGSKTRLGRCVLALRERFRGKAGILDSEIVRDYFTDFRYIFCYV